MSVHVASVGIGRFGKRSEGLLELATEAAGSVADVADRRPRSET